MTEGVWWDTSGTAYAAFVPNPSDCATPGATPSPGPAGSIPVVVKLEGDAWVVMGTGTLKAGYGPDGWTATLTGTASDGQATGSLTISDGSTSVTVPGVSGLAWAP